MCVAPLLCVCPTIVKSFKLYIVHKGSSLITTVKLIRFRSYVRNLQVPLKFL